jgi:hypothetical protein
MLVFVVMSMRMIVVSRTRVTQIDKSYPGTGTAAGRTH